jgi:hypothetical protein
LPIFGDFKKLSTAKNSTGFYEPVLRILSHRNILFYGITSFQLLSLLALQETFFPPQVPLQVHFQLFPTLTIPEAVP